jgi:hypothetical protein
MRWRLRLSHGLNTDYTDFSSSNKKGPAKRGLSLASIVGGLFGCNACRTGSFFALANRVLNRLSFAQTRVAGCLDFRVVNEQVRAPIVGDDESETLRIIEPFYFSCTHYNAPWPFIWPSIYNMPLTFVFGRISLKGGKICSTRPTLYHKSPRPHQK